MKVRAQDVKGDTLMLTLNGWQARIFLHEYDHLQASGLTFHLHSFVCSIMEIVSL